MGVLIYGITKLGITNQEFFQQNSFFFIVNSARYLNIDSRKKQSKFLACVYQFGYSNYLQEIKSIHWTCKNHPRPYAKHFRQFMNVCGGPHGN